MYESNVPAQSWFYAKVRWAVMVEGRGIREWKEAGILFHQSCVKQIAHQVAQVGN